MLSFTLGEIFFRVPEDIRDFSKPFDTSSEGVIDEPSNETITPIFRVGDVLIVILDDRVLLALHLAFEADLELVASLDHLLERFAELGLSTPDFILERIAIKEKAGNTELDTTRMRNNSSALHAGRKGGVQGGRSTYYLLKPSLLKSTHHFILPALTGWPKSWKFSSLK